MAATIDVPKISLRDFENRKDEITKQLLEAAETAGFMALVDHGVTIEDIENQFAMSKAFFALPKEVKGRIPHDFRTNNGWEYYSQVRKTTGTADQKESFWLQRRSQWPSDEDVPGFGDTTRSFLDKCEAVSTQVLRCFAIALGFPEHYFTEAMDTTQEDALSQLRLLHYPPSANNPDGTWRAGLHTDVGCLTLLFQRDGEDGLEVCPGRQSADSSERGDTFFSVPAETGPIVINIGDMLMAWSDDRLKANFHRVRAKGKEDNDRYSIAYFNTGRRNFVMQGPQKKYPAMTCGEYFSYQAKLQFGNNKPVST